MMAISQNGWLAFPSTAGYAGRRQVPGTDVWLTVRYGSPGDLLIWVAEQIDQRVESIDNGRGTVDDGAWNYRPIEGSPLLSNHASATAVDLNWSRHPLGASGTFSAAQVAEIKKIMAETGGAIRWGGIYTGRKDEMHYEVNTDQAGCDRAWAAIQERQRQAQQVEEDDMPILQLNLHGMKVGERRVFELPWGEGQVVLGCDGGSCKVRGVQQIDRADTSRGYLPLFGDNWSVPAHFERVIRSEQQGSDNVFKFASRRICKVAFDLLEMTPSVATEPEKFSLSAMAQFWQLGE